MESVKFLRIDRICISDYFVIIHTDGDHHMSISRVHFTHVYNQDTPMCTHPESAHGCDKYDMHVAANFWVTCTVCTYVHSYILIIVNACLTTM